MKTRQIISLIVGTILVTLSPLAWAAPHGGGAKKKYVMITGSNIPVPVSVAKGPLPKTTVPIRSYSEDEFRKTGAQTPAQILANDPSIMINGR
jgi:hypothetical protein